jgi:hypothetical protein
MSDLMLRRAFISAGTIILIAIMVVSRNHFVSCGFAALLPWLAVAVIEEPARRTSLQGWPRLDTESFTYAMLLPILALTLAAMRISLVYPGEVLIPVMVVTGFLCLLAASLARLRAARRRFTWVLITLPFYSYACVVLADSMFDASATRSYQVRILERTWPFTGWRSGDQTTLAPWHPGQEPRKFRAGLPTWLNAGNVACIDERVGAFGIAWFEVRACDAPAH